MQRIVCLAFCAITASTFAACKTTNADLELNAAEKALADAKANRSLDCAGEITQAAERALAEAKALVAKGDVEAAKKKAIESEQLAGQAKASSPPDCDKKKESGDADASLDKAVPSASNEASRNMDGAAIEQTVYFDFNEAILREDSKAILTRVAQALKDNTALEIEIEGHCDERGSTEFNLHLGERRARAVEKYLVTQGAKSTQITTISYGEERPADPTSTEGAWAKNRRAEIKRR